MAFNRTLQHFTSSQELATQWASGQNYILDQIVLESDKLYVCTVTHTSGATFAGDAAYWTGVGPGQTISIADGGTGQTTATAGFNALAPTTTAGDFIVHNGTDNVRQGIGSDGQVLVVDTSQTNKLKWTNLQQGAKNYITYGTFENGATTGWSLSHSTLDATTKLPNQASGSWTSATSLAISAISSGQLAGSYSLQLSSTASTTAGDMLVTDALTLDLEAQASVQTFSFFYKVTGNGTGTPNFSGTSSNAIGVAIYDVTNSAWIQPAGVFNLVQSSGVGKSSGTFQVPSNCTSVRLAVYFPNSTAASGGSPFTVVFDDFVLGPQVVVNGPSGPVGEIIAFGSLTPPVGFLYCDGSAVSRTQYADLFKAISTTYGVGDGSTTFNLPDLRGVFARGAGSRTIGAETYSATLGNSQNDATAVNGLTVGTPTNWADGNSVYTTNAAGAYYWKYPGWRSDFVGSDANRLLGVSHNHSLSGDTETRPANVAVAYHIRYLATYQMSNDTDTRVVAANSYLNSAQTVSVTTAVQVLFDFKTFDTHSAMSATGVYTAPVSGYYRVTASLYLSNITSGEAYGIDCYKNSGATILFGRFIRSSTTNAIESINGTVYLNAGENIAIYVDSAVDTSYTVVNSSSGSWFAVERLSGPATIAASESVIEQWDATGGGNISSGGNTVVFTNKIQSTHGAFNGSTFTAPISGTYSVAWRIQTSTQTPNTSQSVYSQINKGLSAYAYGTEQYGNGATIAPTSVGSIMIKLNAGEQISLVGVSSITTALRTTGLACYINIAKVGN